MIHKEDAKSITDAKKLAYIKEKTLVYVPECFKNIREAANKMRYQTTVHVEGVQFIPEIIYELQKVMEQAGYTTSTTGGRGGSMFIYIYWRELTEKEKKEQSI